MDEHARRTPHISTSTAPPLSRSVASGRSLPSEHRPQQLVSAELPCLLRQQFGRLLNALPDGVVIADDAGTIQFANTQTASLFGYQRDELIGHAVESLMPERFHGVHPDHRAEYLANPHVRPMGTGLQLVGVRRDGSEFPVEISLSPIEVAETRLVLATIRDVTDRKQVEMQLRQAEREAERRAVELDAILETQTDVVVLVRPGNTVVRINASGLRLLGLQTQTEREVRAFYRRPLTEQRARFAFYDEQGRRLHPDELPTHRVLQGETLTGATTMRVVLRRRGEPDVLLEVVGAPIRGPGGQVMGGVVTLRDVTQRVRLEWRTRDALTAVLAMAEALVLAPEEANSTMGTLAETMRSANPTRSMSETGAPQVSDRAPSTTRSRSRAAREQQPGGRNAAAYELASLTRAIVGCQHVAIAAWESDASDAETMVRPVALAGHCGRDAHEWRHWLRWYNRRLNAPTAPRAPDALSPAVAIIARLMAGAIVAINLAPKPESVPARKRTYAFGHSLLVPMHIGGRFIGCLALDFGAEASRLALDDGDLALVNAVAKLAALVTERDRLLADHRARIEAEARLTLLQSVLDELPSAVYLACGRDGELVLANRQVREVWGAEWPVGQPMHDFLTRSGIQLLDLHNREMEPDQLATLRALRTGSPVRQQQEVIHRPDGSSLSILVNAIALDPHVFSHLSDAYDPARASTPLPLVLVVLQDVSALKEAERLKDEFIAMAAHEIRNPVAALAGYAQMLTPHSRPVPGSRGRVRRMAPIEWQAEAADAVLQASNRLAALTDDLLDATRLHANRLTLRSEPTELGALVRRVVKRAQVTTSHHTLIVEQPAEPVLVEVDVQRVEQVLTNLLSNSIKYSPDGGAVTVTLEARAVDMPAESAGNARVADDLHDAADAHAASIGVARVSVRDQGLGIPFQEQPHIFGRFVRAGNARERGIPGTGLGLYLCRELIELHHGRIWFESVEDVGTTFTVELPLWNEPGDTSM